MKKTLLLTTTLLALTTAQADITLGSADHFATTSENWVSGTANLLAPAHNTGAGQDSTPGYLRTRADGAGAGGKLQFWNTSSEWTGNYLAAGITHLTLWADNQTASSPLSLRIAFKGPGGIFNTTPQALPTSSGWTQLSYSLSDTFNQVAGSPGTGLLSDTLQNVTQLFILHSTSNPTYAPSGAIPAGDPVTATLHLDSIQAIPEPNALLLITLGAIALLHIKRRK